MLFSLRIQSCHIFTKVRNRIRNFTLARLLNHVCIDKASSIGTCPATALSQTPCNLAHHRRPGPISCHSIKELLLGISQPPIRRRADRIIKHERRIICH